MVRKRKLARCRLQIVEVPRDLLLGRHQSRWSELVGVNYTALYYTASDLPTLGYGFVDAAYSVAAREMSS